jgi:hypothetical protein
MTMNNDAIVDYRGRADALLAGQLRPHTDNAGNDVLERQARCRLIVSERSVHQTGQIRALTKLVYLLLMMF